MNIQAFNEVVRARYASLVDGIDWWFEDKGEGVVLARWPAGLAVPTEAEVEAKAADLAKTSALAANNAAYSAATRAITADYPQLEKDTWPTQDKESKAWVADPDNAPTPWINRAADTRGIPATSTYAAPWRKPGSLRSSAHT